jgi:hypothetical protein
MQVLTKKDDVQLNDGMKSRYYFKETQEYILKILSFYEFPWKCLLAAKISICVRVKCT